MLRGRRFPLRAGSVSPVGVGEDRPYDANDDQERAGPEGYGHDEGNEMEKKPGGDEAETEDDQVLGNGRSSSCVMG